MPRFAILPAAELLLDRLLRPDPAKGWVLVDRKIRREHIDAHYRQVTGAWAFVRIMHPTKVLASSVPQRTSAKLRLTLLRSSSPACERLLDSLVEQVRAHEAEWTWGVIADPQGESRIDPERIAFITGIKPALRITLELEDLERVRSSYAEFATAVNLGPTPTLYVAHTQAQADHLHALELEFDHLDDITRSARLNTELGDRLGYPDCCTRAFVELEMSSAPPVDHNWIRAQHFWHPQPHARINNVLAGERLFLISFVPCSYRCAAALAQANQIAAAVAEREPEAMAQLDRALACNVALDAAGEVAVVELVEDRIVAARPARVITSRAPDTELSQRILGARVGEQGLVKRPGPTVRVMCFTHQSEIC